MALIPLDGPRTKQLTVFVVATALGFCVNLFPVPLFFGLQFVLGGVFSTAVALLYGPLYGAASAVVVFLPTIKFWGHPYAVIVYALEALWLGYWYRRVRNWPMELDIAFWLLVGGVASYLFYGVKLGLPMLDLAVVFLKQIVNSLAATAGAGLLLLILPRKLTPQRLEYTLPVYYSQALTIICIVPLVIALPFFGRFTYENLWESRNAEIKAAGDESAAKVDHWLNEYQNVAALVADQAQRGLTQPQLQSLLESAVTSHPGLHNMYVADRTGTTVAFYPPVNDLGGPTIGLNFADRPYFQEMVVTGKPLVTDAFMGRGGVHEPIVVVTHPFVDRLGCFAGYALAAIQIDARFGADRLLPPPGANQVLVDGSGQVVSANRDFEVLDRFRMPVGDSIKVGNDTVVQLVSPGQSTLTRWDHSEIVAAKPVPGTGWQIYTIASAHPIKVTLFSYYTWLFMAAVCFMIVAAVLLTWFSRILTRPILDLSAVDMGNPDLENDPRLTRWLDSPIPEVRRLVAHIGDSAAQLSFLAYHDSLTHLPNRALLMSRLTALFGRPGEQAVLLYLDLDGFKIINDSLSHDVGDLVLAAAAARVRAKVLKEFIVARVGDDEFAVLMEGATARAEADRLAGELIRAFDAPLIVNGAGVFVTASVGTVFSFQAQDAAEFLRFGDVAMCEAKHKGKRQHVAFDPTMNQKAVARLGLELDLRRALANREFLVYYQPIVDLKTGTLVAMEALVRWQHPERGLVAPSEFIPLAEDTGLVVPLGRWVLETACRDLRSWQEQGLAGPRLRMAVNLSAKQFQQPALVAEVARILHERGLDPECLQLEITESAVMHDAEASRAILLELRQVGVRLAVDDFGTGYSSLSYLQMFPIDTLKIDRSFVNSLGRDRDVEAIVHAMVTLGQVLHLGIVAEGVETPEQVAVLQRLGVERGQGYLFARPMTREAALALLVRTPNSA
ncbi:MAG TPA: EAL domain-containing protein [Symbiobacteriaceae bacterium]|jgi:diguanylate cyclase (GGDEF)-like protein